MSIESYCPKMPLDLDENSRFVMITDSLSNIKQKLKMIVLTNPGEKLMEPEFGLGIKKYLFEPTSGIVEMNSTLNTVDMKNLRSTLLSNLVAQVYRYSPDISIQDLNISITDNIANITINYSYLGYTTDVLTVTLTG